jgi:hypothetical protein|tara:strand:+ start:152 stop:427 length:276 start_codon:yes stop_codon:yes gene_type:complete
MYSCNVPIAQEKEMARVKKLTPSYLKKLVLEEKQKLKVESEEVDAKDMANTLAKNVDYLKALKIHETSLTLKLKRVLKEKARVKKKILRDL